MAWSFVGVSAAVTVSTTAHALTEPAGVAAGDLLIAVISSRIASTTSITLPAGWTLVAESKTNNVVAAATTSEASGMMAYIVRGASAPALTFTHPTAPSVAMGRIVAYRGQKATSPFDVGVGNKTSTNITAVSLAGLTTAEAEELIVRGVCSGRASAFSAFDAATDPTTSSGTSSVQTAAPITGTWQERQDSSTTTGADTALAIADAVRGTAGATGNLTCTASVAGGHVQVSGAFKMEPPVESTVVQTGSTLEFALGTAANTGTVSSTITVPADAEFVVACVAGYSGTANFFSTGSMTFTKGGVDTAMTSAATAGDASGSFYMGAMFYLALPDTGSNKTLKWDWLGSATASHNDPRVVVSFWKGVDTASPVRDGDGAQKDPITGINTPTLTAVSGDRVIAWATWFSGGVNGSVDVWSNLSTVFNATNTPNADGALSSGSPTGNTTVGVVSGTSLSDGSITAIVVKPGETNITGTMDADETADVFASPGGVVRWEVTLDADESLDVLAATGSVRWQATLATSEAVDTALFNGTVRWAATFVPVEPPDIALFNGTVRWEATLAASEAPDVAAFAGTVLLPLDGTLSVTEPADGMEILGAVFEPVTGTLGAVEPYDIANFISDVVTAGELVATEAPDEAYIFGDIFDPVTADLQAAEDPDVALLEGSVSWAGDLVVTELPDVAEMSGFVEWNVILAIEEPEDVLIFNGTVRWPATLATAEPRDTALFNGTVRWAAILAASEAPDVAVINGGAALPIKTQAIVIA